MKCEYFTLLAYILHVCTIYNPILVKFVHVTAMQSASWHKACRVQFNNTKLERARKRRDRGMKSDDGPSVVKHTRSSLGNKEVPSSSTTNVSPEKRCFFCEQDLTQAVKYKRVAATFALDKRVRQYAMDLGDSRLLTKLAGGDMVATEAEYHANCLTSFYKLHLKYVERSSQTTTSNNIHGIVFAEVVAYIEEARYDDDKPMFKLADLVQLYNDRLRELGEDDKVHSSRLKENMLSQIPNLSAHTSVHSQGQNVIIMFDRDVADLVQEERMNRDYDMDAMYSAKAAEIVRLGMFRNSYSFDGSFSPDCQTNVIPGNIINVGREGNWSGWNKCKHVANSIEVYNKIFNPHIKSLDKVRALPKRMEIRVGHTYS